MLSVLSLLAFLTLSTSCQESASTALYKTDTTTSGRPQKLVPKDSVTIDHIGQFPQDTLKKEYSQLKYMGVELLKAAPGTKSVLFNSSGSRLYAMNLEGMSVYEFDQATRKIVREFF